MSVPFLAITRLGLAQITAKTPALPADRMQLSHI